MVYLYPCKSQVAPMGARLVGQGRTLGHFAESAFNTQYRDTLYFEMQNPLARGSITLSQ